MKIEPTLHQLDRVAFEVAPLVGIREARGGDPRSCRQIAQNPAIRFAEWTVDRPKLVILVFAHDRARLVL
ncbi:hypothetical protein [Mesorhizobium sp.]|uniref:hypothetical protein n=1 Tax=Mesorhizobium sp. TaxID=1871066 RepID=UPI0025EDABEC|nr:hypothetical protein [Mesorhizobium sp.]